MAGFVVGRDHGAKALDERLELVDDRCERIRIDEELGPGQQLVQKPDAEADGGPGLTPRTVAKERGAGGLGFRGDGAAGRDRHDGQAALACRGEARQGLGGLPGVARCHDEGAGPDARGQPVVAMHDQRNAQPIPCRGGHQLGADRRSAHRQHGHEVDVAVGLVERHRSRYPARLRQLAGHGGDPRQHPLRIDPGQDRRVVQRDRLVERWRTVVVRGLGGVRAPGLVVGLAVAEVVAGVHQAPAAPAGCAAPARRRPSASSASTSSGDRAST